MSYEHCDEHDEPATNGCERCKRERVGEWMVVRIDAGAFSGMWQARVAETQTHRGRVGRIGIGVAWSDSQRNAELVLEALRKAVEESGVSWIEYFEVY